MGELHEVRTRRRGGHGVGCGLAARPGAIGDPIERCGQTQGAACVILHALDRLGVGIDDQANGLTGERVGDLEALALIGDGAVLAYKALLAVIKHGIELGGAGAEAAHLRQVLLVTRQGREPVETRVRRAMVDLFQPRPKSRIKVRQMENLTGVDLAQELIAQGAMPALELPLRFGRIRSAVDQMDAQAGADPLQGVGPVGGAVIDDKFDG